MDALFDTGIKVGAILFLLSCGYGDWHWRRIPAVASPMMDQVSQNQNNTHRLSPDWEEFWNLLARAVLCSSDIGSL
jgi:hypothetical protein